MIHRNCGNFWVFLLRRTTQWRASAVSAAVRQRSSSPEKLRMRHSRMEDITHWTDPKPPWTATEAGAEDEEAPLASEIDGKTWEKARKKNHDKPEKTVKHVLSLLGVSAKCHCARCFWFIGDILNDGTLTVSGC